MKNKVAILFILFSLLFLGFNVSAYAAPSPVDGFLGVSWGASREQVRAAMAEKGFAFIGKDVNEDTYEGTFSDYPALITFAFQNNIFCLGSVYFSQEPRDKIFYGISELITAKYGTPSVDDSNSGLRAKIWQRLPTTVKPQGEVEIKFVSFFYHKPYMHAAKYHHSLLTYSIGANWVLLQNAKDI